MMVPSVPQISIELLASGGSGIRALQCVVTVACAPLAKRSSIVAVSSTSIP